MVLAAEGASAEGAPGHLNSVLIVGLCIVVPPLLVALSLFYARVIRSRIQGFNDDSRLGFFRHNCFDGRYRVDVNPAQWRVDAPTARTIAAERGYVEVTPGYLGMLSFVRTAAERAAYTGGSTAVSGGDYGQPSAGVSGLTKQESSLISDIRAAGELWVSLRQHRITGPRMATLLEICGIQYVFTCGDQTDQVMLLRDPHIQGYQRSTVGSRKHTRPTYVLIVFTAAIAFVSIVGAVYFNKTSETIPGLVMMAALIGSIALPLSPRLFNRSRRASLLSREFNGRKGVFVYHSWYGVSDYIVSEMARFHGYMYHEKSYTKMYGSYLKFVRMS